MEEMEVGEYVRTIYGEIAKITQVYPRIKGIKRKNQTLIDFNLIKKHSKNIIDLIEVGDIVNSYIVLDVMEDLQTGEIQLEMPSSYPKEGSCTIYNNEIKTILTKEQFEQNSYKV